MVSESNLARFRRVYDEGFNLGDLTALDDVCAPDYRDHDPTNPTGDLDGLKRTIVLMRAAFPDGRFTIDALLEEGNYVAARVTMRGTQTGEMMGLPATGRSVTATGMDIARFADGRCAEHWGEFDQFGMLQQLGVIPPPGQAAT